MSISGLGIVIRESRLVDALNGLIEVDQAAVVLYDAILARVTVPDLARRLHVFREEHVQQLGALGRAVESLYGCPPRSGRGREHVAEAVVAAGDPATELGELVSILHRGEAATREAYSNAHRSPSLRSHPRIEAVVARGLDHEEQHARYLRGLLDLR